MGKIRGAIAVAGAFAFATAGLVAVDQGTVAAATPAVTALAWDGSEGGHVGQGTEWLAGAGGAGDVLSASGTLTEVTFTAEAASTDWGPQSVEVVLAAPRGTVWTQRTYEDAERLDFRDPSKAGMNISNGNAGCNTATGRIVVHEVTADAAGALTSFAATVEHRCDLSIPLLVVDVRLRSTVPLAARASQHRTLGFVAPEVGGAEDRQVTMTALGPDPLTVGTVTVVGPGAARFAKVADGCGGRILAPGVTCAITVRYLASTADEAVATLVVEDSSARGERRWDLYGNVASGPPPPPAPPPGVTEATTMLVLDDTDVDPMSSFEEVLREGEDVSFDAIGGAGGVHVWLQQVVPGRPPRDLSIELYAPRGDRLEEREYVGAIAGALLDDARPTVRFSGVGSGCGPTSSFRIHELEVGDDGRASSFAASWRIQCHDDSPVSAGEVRWRSTVPVAARRASTGHLGFRPALGSTADSTVALASVGTGELDTENAVVLGSTSFAVVGDSCAPAPVAPGSSCDVTVRYDPSVGDADDALLLIPDNTANGGRLVRLLGIPPQEPEPDPLPPRSGYWMVSASGAVYAFGDASWFGNADIGGRTAVDIEPTPFYDGYLVVTSTGEVYALGAAGWFGNAGELRDGETVSSISSTPTGDGYWLFTSKGRVIARGDAVHLGDMSRRTLNGPVLDSVVTPFGGGYYMVASDGGIFSFGDAWFYGSMGGKTLNKPVESLVPDPDGEGYWLVASDGGVFAFGAEFHGSMGAKPLNRPVTGMVAFGDGYLMVGEDGGIFNFSSQPFHGSLGASPPPVPITSVAALSE